MGKLPGGGGKRPAKGKVGSNETIRKKEQSMVSEVSFEELSILQERLDQKEKEMGEHKERERSLAVKLEQSQVEKQTVENELSKIVGEQEVIKANLQEERGRVRQLEGTKEQLQHKVKEVAQLKAKNAMDLLDFKVRVVGDSTLDDLDQMEEMQQKIEEQQARMDQYQRSEGKLIAELKQLRNQLETSRDSNQAAKQRITSLEQTEELLRAENAALKQSEE